MLKYKKSKIEREIQWNAEKYSGMQTNAEKCREMQWNAEKYRETEIQKALKLALTHFFLQENSTENK